MATNVLITGYTDFISTEFLQTAFPDCRVVITGDCKVPQSVQKKITRFTRELTATTCRNLFHTYDFSQVLFISGSAAPFGSADSAELDTLRNVLGACYPETKIIYVSGPAHPASDPVSVTEEAAMDLCTRLASKAAGVNLLISPWIYSIYADQRALTDLMRPATHYMDYPAVQEISFISSDDLAVLVFRMFEDWAPVNVPFCLPSVFSCTVEDLTKMIQQEVNSNLLEFHFPVSPTFFFRKCEDNVLRTRYLWFPVYSLKEDLHTIVERTVEGSTRSGRSLTGLFPESNPLIHFLELLTAFGVCELLLKVSNISVQFRMIDFRLLAVVIMGTMYNIPMGIAAALMESISLVLAYSRMGTGMVNLFHEPTNWLPFIAYFTVGAVCGYIRSKDRSMLKFAQSEAESLKERYTYLTKMADDVLQEKQEYKKQIIGSRDSLGKIFRIVQQLNQMHPKNLLLKAVEVIETFLDTSCVAIYSCADQAPFGRLSVASRGLDVPYSVPMEAYYDRLKTLSEGEVWVNRELEPDMPQFLYGVRKNGHIEMIIIITQADFSQMTLYYENLFRVVCGMISTALIRALDYQDVLQSNRCIEGSELILSPRFFLEELQFAANSYAQKHAVHLLLRVNCSNRHPEQIEPLVEKCIRNTDVMGIIDDRLYVLLLQAREGDLPFISTRFESVGLTYELISREQQELLLKEKVG